MPSPSRPASTVQPRAESGEKAGLAALSREGTSRRGTAAATREPGGGRLVLVSGLEASVISR